MDFWFLNHLKFWKSNGQIKGYNSRKWADTLGIIRNDIGFILIKRLDQKSTFDHLKKSTLGQIWPKLTKSSNYLGFDVETWRMSFWWSFDLNDILNALMSKQVKPWWSRCSHTLSVRKWFFWNFQGPAHKSRMDKIWYQQMKLEIISRVAWECSTCVDYVKSMWV